MGRPRSGSGGEAEPPDTGEFSKSFKIILKGISNIILAFFKETLNALRYFFTGLEEIY